MGMLFPKRPNTRCYFMQKTILIIEDDSNIRELLRLYLSQEGYKIETAQDGMEGLRAFRAHEPDLILLD